VVSGTEKGGKGRPLTLVGSMMSGREYRSRFGVSGVDKDLPIVCSIKPSQFLELMQYPWQWMLTPHTWPQIATSTFAGLFIRIAIAVTHGYYW